LRREVIEAARDYRYLLDRGYPVKLALDTVSSKYMLSKKERLLLYRCVHSSKIAGLIRSKTSIPPEYSKIIIDGFNVFATIYTALKGDQVYLCDDGIIRDLSGLHSRIAISLDKNILCKILDFVSDIISLRNYDVLIVLDANVTYSGETAAYMRKYFSKKRLSIKVNVEKMADKSIIMKKTSAWLSSSDIIILLNAEKIYDLAAEVIRNHMPKQIVKMPL